VNERVPGWQANHPTRDAVRLPGDFLGAHYESRYALEVVTSSGRAAAVEFRFQSDSVEVWHAQRCRGVFDRGVLQAWLTTPRNPLVANEVTFSLDRMVDYEGRVSLSLPGVTCWTLSPADLAGLVKRMRRLPLSGTNCQPHRQGRAP
jgi:hypothetical protein